MLRTECRGQMVVDKTLGGQMVAKQMSHEQVIKGTKCFIHYQGQN